MFYADNPAPGIWRVVFRADGDTIHICTASDQWTAFETVYDLNKFRGYT